MAGQSPLQAIKLFPAAQVIDGDDCFSDPWKVCESTLRANAPSIKTFAAQYSIIQLASGQSSELHKAVWALSAHDYKPVALKCIRLRNPSEKLNIARDQNHGVESTQERIIGETVIWMKLKHPNVLPFYGYQKKDVELILVSRWSENASLDTFLAVHLELTRSDKLELLHEAARGLEYLHSLEYPIAHGNIQPGNVIITDGQCAALSDVGLPRVMADSDVRNGLSTGGQGVKSSVYQAKELIVGDSLPTTMSDLYAFGGLILSTLSGKQPFWKAKTSALTLISIANGSTPLEEDHPEIDPRAELEAYINCDDPRLLTAPARRTLIKIPILDEDTTAMEAAGSNPRSQHDSITSGELPFQSGAARDLEPELKLEGRLAKIEPVGSGGFGQVFQGVWIKTDGTVVIVAIKSIRSSVVAKKSGEASEPSNFMKRIIRETTIWKVAQHPNILAFYGYQIAGEEAMLVSAWCPNGSLESYIYEHKELRDTDKLKLLCDAARGLAYLHSLEPPIAHGDIKPQNVVITDSVEAALCDFGMARVMCDPSTGVTSQSLGAGTIQYQAKELFLDSPLPTNMSDLCAFGGLILATMSGKPPFYQNGPPTSVILAITRDETPQPVDHLELEETDPL
ncbi:hypothetical protein FRC01_003547 [Tulasnella sp. 417]|nr:hypothetical protein FRC01_003547 [Tulasnella sp. 417]